MKFVRFILGTIICLLAIYGGYQIYLQHFGKDEFSDDFLKELRDSGFDVGSGDGMDAVSAMMQSDLGEPTASFGMSGSNTLPPSGSPGGASPAAVPGGLPPSLRNSAGRATTVAPEQQPLFPDAPTTPPPASPPPPPCDGPDRSRNISDEVAAGRSRFCERKHAGRHVFHSLRKSACTIFGINAGPVIGQFDFRNTGHVAAFVCDNCTNDLIDRRCCNANAITAANAGGIAVVRNRRRCRGERPFHPDAIARKRGIAANPGTFRLYVRRRRAAGGRHRHDDANGAIARKPVGHAFAGSSARTATRNALRSGNGGLPSPCHDG